VEEEFQKLFKLTDEHLIKTYTCKFKKETTKAKGTLYLSHNHACFSADMFGRRLKEKVAIRLIRDIKLVENNNNKRIEIEVTNRVRIFFKDFENIVDAHNVILQFWEQKSVNQSETYIENSNEEKTEEGEDMGLSPTEDEWTKILEGTRSIQFSKDDYVITQEHEQPQRLYQIACGSCRIEKTTEDGQTVVIGVIATDSIFGEIAFLVGPGGRATASVVANEDTVVNVIEGYYLNILFEYYSGLSGRFYHFLGSAIAKRIKMREAALLKREEDESEMDTAEEDKSELSETKKDELTSESKKILSSALKKWKKNLKIGEKVPTE